MSLSRELMLRALRILSNPRVLSFDLREASRLLAEAAEEREAEDCRRRVVRITEADRAVAADGRA